MSSALPTHKIRALVDSWLLLDFFGEARRTGANASTLTTTIFSQSFLSLALSALIYPEPPPVPFAAAMLCLSTLLIALGALDAEQGLARRRADRVLLGTAPISRLQSAMARALHASFRIMLLTIGMALPPGIMLACREGNAWLAPCYVLAACLSAALSTGTLSVLLLFVRRFFGAARAALFAGSAKALMLGFGLVLLLLGLPSLRKTADSLPIGRLGAELLPPYHLAKVLASPQTEAWRLWPLLGIGVLLLLAAAVIGEQERERRERHPSGGLLDRLALRWARSPQERGITAFCTAMLWRSANFRAHALPLLGIPAAIAFLSLRSDNPQSRHMFLGMALQFPGIYLPFLIAFLPRSDFASAQWLFASAPNLPQAMVRRATRIALLTHVLLPVHLLAWTALIAFGAPILQVLGAGVFALAAAGLAARPMLRDLQAMPFTREAGVDERFEFGNVMAYALLLGAAGAAFAIAHDLGRALLLTGAVLFLIQQLASKPSAAATQADGLWAFDSAGQSADQATPALSAATRTKAGKRQPDKQQSLRRELQAIAFLYFVVAVLPLLIGIAFAPNR
jgi:hypothetical protein